MSLKAICEVILYFESFKNIDLGEQGVYTLKARIKANVTLPPLRTSTPLPTATSSPPGSSDRGRRTRSGRRQSSKTTSTRPNPSPSDTTVRNHPCRRGDRSRRSGSLQAPTGDSPCPGNRGLPPPGPLLRPRHKLRIRCTLPLTQP